jgi:hypothetical protein
MVAHADFSGKIFGEMMSEMSFELFVFRRNNEEVSVKLMQHWDMQDCSGPQPEIKRSCAKSASVNKTSIGKARARTAKRMRGPGWCKGERGLGLNDGIEMGEVVYGQRCSAWCWGECSARESCDHQQGGVLTRCSDIVHCIPRHKRRLYTEAAGNSTTDDNDNQYG